MNSIIKQHELQNAQTTASGAASDFNTTQVTTNSERIVACERVGWFCAGAISLSFTLIGYLLSKDELLQIVRQDFIHVPLICILVIAWICFAISILSSLVVRHWNATYSTYNSGCVWASTNKDLNKKMLEAINAGVPIVFTGVNSTQQAHTNAENSRKNYENIEKSMCKRSKIWLKMTNYSQASVYAGAFLGILLLVVFLVTVTLRIAV